MVGSRYGSKLDLRHCVLGESFKPNHSFVPLGFVALDPASVVPLHERFAPVPINEAHF